MIAMARPMPNKRPPSLEYRFVSDARNDPISSKRGRRPEELP